MSVVALELTIVIAYAAVALVTGFGLSVHAEYWKLENNKEAVDKSSIPTMAAAWPVTFFVIACVFLWSRASSGLLSFPLTPSRIALLIHRRKRVRRFAKTVSAEVSGYRDTAERVDE